MGRTRFPGLGSVRRQLAPERPSCLHAFSSMSDRIIKAAGQLLGHRHWKSNRSTAILALLCSGTDLQFRSVLSLLGTQQGILGALEGPWELPHPAVYQAI